MKNDMTLSEMTESLTGFEEDLIVEHFGADIADLLADRPTKAYRALIMVDARRGAEPVGVKDAVKQAQSYRMDEAFSYFRDDADDAEQADPETLETPAGKGEQPES